MSYTSKNSAEAASATALVPEGRKVPRRWGKLTLLTGTLWADSGETSFLSTLSPVIIAALSLPVGIVGVLVAISKGIAIVFGPVWSLVASRTNRKWTLVITTALVAVMTAATGLAQDLTSLLVLWCIAAVFTSAALPLVTAITADLFSESSRGRANGFTWAIISLTSAVVGPLIGQLAAVTDGWRIAFYLAGGFAAVITILLVVAFTDPGIGASDRRQAVVMPRRSRENLVADLGKLFRIPSFTVLAIERFFSARLLMNTLAVLFLVKELGFSIQLAATIAAPIGIGGLVGTLAGGLLSDLFNRISPRYGRVIVFQTASLIAPALLIAVALMQSSNFAIYLILLGVAGFASGASITSQRSVFMAITPVRLRGIGAAVMFSVIEAAAFLVWNLGSAVTVSLFGLGWTFLWLAGVLTLASALVLVFLYRAYAKDAMTVAATADTTAVSLPTPEENS